VDLDTTSITDIELSQVAENRRNHIQNLEKYRTDAAKAYQASLQKLQNTRDDE
jgi:thiamine pyrophosphokinase